MRTNEGMSKPIDSASNAAWWRNQFIRKKRDV